MSGSGPVLQCTRVFQIRRRAAEALGLRGGEEGRGPGSSRGLGPFSFFFVLSVSAEVGLACALCRGEEKKSWALAPEASPIGLCPFSFSV